MTHRARHIALVAHCHLNMNAKLHGLATQPALQAGLLARLSADQTGIVQLPCPETTFLGMSRWGMTYEQYATPAYRRHCRSLLQPVVDTVVALVADGCELVGVWGADGSPSCAINETSVGYAGGEVQDACASETPPTSTRAAGRGVLIEELDAMLKDAGITTGWYGIDERHHSGDGAREYTDGVTTWEV